VEVSKASKILFTGLIRLGLVCLDLGPALQTTVYTVVDSIDRIDLTDIRKSEMLSINHVKAKSIYSIKDLAILA
jgi:hypothetical protein